MVEIQTPPMMQCGHAANAVRSGTTEPVCVICLGIVPGADVVDDSPPDLTGREARCNHDNGDAKHANKRIPSSTSSAFFTYQPKQKFDRYYCGCFGWD